MKEKFCNFIEKKSQAQAFSCEFSEISKNTFFYRTLRVATSGELQTSKSDVENRIEFN